MSRNLQFEVTWRVAESDFTDVVQVNTKRKQVFRDPANLYSTRLPISMQKYRDLVDLCCIKREIPEHFHQEYINLPHSGEVQDALSSPDEEENEDDI